MIHCLAVVLCLTGVASAQPVMEPLVPGEVRPTGWLYDWCDSARKGYTGRMLSVHDQFRRAWATNFTPQTSLQWQDRKDPKTGRKELGFWSAEGGAYWFAGLINLAYILDDPELKALAHERIDGLLERMHPDAMSFCWWFDRNDKERWKDTGNGWFFGPCGALARGLCDWYLVTKDPKILRALEWATDDPRFYAQGCSYSSLPGAAVEVWRLGGNEKVKAAAESFYARAFAPGAKNESYYAFTYALDPQWVLANRCPVFSAPVIPESTKVRRQFQHGVFANEAIASWIKGFWLTGDRRFLDRALAWQAYLDANVRQPHGAFVADEYYGAAGPFRGTETCVVSLDIETRTAFLEATGDGKWGDEVERTFFNAAPACVGRGFMTHCYHQVPNQMFRNRHLSFSTGGVGETRIQPSHSTLCCTAALNRLLPDFVRGAWMRTADGGLAACFWAPMTVRTQVGGADVAIDVKTEYPFGETVMVSVKPSREATFPLKLRLPSWCAKPAVTLNGAAVTAEPKDGFLTFARTWKAGDVVALTFPMEARLESGKDWSTGCSWSPGLWHSFLRGPLLYALGIPEGKDANTPADPHFDPVRRFNAKTALQNATFVRRSMPARWDWAFDAPCRLTVTDVDGKPVELIPYGCTKLRWTMFEGVKQK